MPKFFVNGSTGDVNLGYEATGTTPKLEWDASAEKLTVTGTAEITTADINGGTIDAADITVGAGKTLDVSAGTLTLANDQISGDAINGGTIGSVAITSADINGGTVDGITSLSVSGTSSLNGAVTINESGADVDFRIESDTDANAFFLEGSSSNVGIGTSSPQVKLTSYIEATGSIPTDETVGVANPDPNTVIGAWNGSNSATFSAIALQTRTSGASRWMIANEWKSTFLGDLVFRNRNGGTTSAERMRIDSSGNLLFNSGYGSVATAYGCRAWVNFNGTGTVAIRGSGNVSSITDSGTGDYKVNFTTAMPDANYTWTATGDYTVGSAKAAIVTQRGNVLTASCEFAVTEANTAYTRIDSGVSAVFHR